MKRSHRFKRSIKPKKSLDIKLTNSNNEQDITATTSMTLSSSIKPSSSLIRANSNLKPQIPISSSSLISFEKSSILSQDFFQIDALDLAPRLLGKFLRRDDVVLQITEVEAYRPNDSACHGRFGVTPRTAPVFGPGGHAYVYLCYGLHTMLNIVADKEGVGAAVLIRSCAPVCGLETIQLRRGQKTEKPVLLAGPGGLEVLDGPEPENILIGPRVGIAYASPEHVNALWRFVVADSPWISAPKNTLGPPP
ncbi:DNA-3-methyladenine glycosylase-like isoform X2 [Papaver somniferum]|uniref:DNA-3-methyladenine glycosylase-like isoform X2 n=1 Tax=Papaver somniferum TaxID=3469 RepID=UPI000E703794|nr:DNA-3-methyladenine glycosylase-like isoform X2 [Papaver somniferum]